MKYYLLFRNQFTASQNQTEQPSSKASEPTDSAPSVSDIQSEVQRVRQRISKLAGSAPEEKLGAHAQEHHVAVDKLLFIPTREEVLTISCSSFKFHATKSYLLSNQTQLRVLSMYARCFQASAL